MHILIIYQRSYPSGDRDPRQPLQFLGAGQGPIAPGEFYALATKRVRRDIYALVYLSAGEGFLHTQASGRVKVQAGDAFLLFPQVWHSYSPSPATGWSEHWIMFHGDQAAQWEANGLIQRQFPLLQPGADHSLLNLFDSLLKLQEEPSPHQEALQLSALEHILLHTLHLSSRRSLRRAPHTPAVDEACRFLSAHFSEEIDMPGLAEKLHLSYGNFRRLFRKQTGRSPQQYLLDLRLSRACKLLEDGVLSIKEVAGNTGFANPYYFSRLFKQRMGIPPSHWQGL